MSIFTDFDNNRTICECDHCHAQAVTTRADGVVAENWRTGQFLLDVSMTEILNIPLCFCPACQPTIQSIDRTNLVIGKLEAPEA